MRYMGGKYRLAKPIAEFLQGIREIGQPFADPFVGAANIVTKMDGVRFASDIHPDLVMLLKAVRDNEIELPDEVTEAEYAAQKNAEPSALRGFVGFGCSFGGRWFKGYARGGHGADAVTAKRSLHRKRDGLTGVSIARMDYREFHPSGMLVYLDPPYETSTKKFANGKFCSRSFWDYARHLSKDNQVVVSEYHAPDDFKCVKSFDVKQCLRTKTGGCERRTEKLFMWRG